MADTRIYPRYRTARYKYILRTTPAGARRGFLRSRTRARIAEQRGNMPSELYAVQWLPTGAGQRTRLKRSVNFLILF